MTPDRYEISPPGARRLDGALQERGARTGLTTGVGFAVGAVFAFAVGAVFAAIGTAIILAGTKVIEVDPRSVHAPYWVLTMAGASFAELGLVVWGMAWRQLAPYRARAEAIRRHPNEPALADYRWHPEGFEVSEWQRFAPALLRPAGLTVFLSVFNWMAFGAKGEFEGITAQLMIKGITAVFDLLAVMLWCLAAWQLGRALKFGHSRVAFTTFPCRLSDPVVLRWQPFKGINRINKGGFTLRCVTEWWERGGRSGFLGLRKDKLVHDETWSAKWLVEQPRNFHPRDDVELRYELPANAQPTNLSAPKPVYWELEVKLDLPGLNFNQAYLIPIYAPAQTPAVKASSPESGMGFDEKEDRDGRA
jgi:hypothetical protein